MEIEVRKHRRKPLELQLTAMIDIFSMIVIFLILGTVFGAAEIILPKDLALPKSVSKEGLESAPRLVIQRDRVTTSISDETLGVEIFRGEGASNHSSVIAVKDKIKKYFASRPASEKGKSAYLNVIADAETPYRDIFDVIKVFREAGFDTLLFVATGEGKAQ